MKEAAKGKTNERVTIVLKQTLFLQNNLRPTHLTENKHTRSANKVSRVYIFPSSRQGAGWW